MRPPFIGFQTVAQNIVINGALPATLTNPVFQATTNVNNYTQIAIQNKSAGVNASSDHIAYPDNVTVSDVAGFMDMGITSSGFAQAAYAITGPCESYLFGSAPTGATTGNMIIATDSTGSLNSLQFGTNGFAAKANIRMTIFKSGRINIGGGGSPVDDGANALQINGSLFADGNVNLASGGAKTITIKDGANQPMGQAVLVAGTVTVAAAVQATANARIFLSTKTPGGIQGFLSYTVNVGVGFTITSSNAADTSTVNYLIIQPG